jgi:hypothetical protein
VTRAAPKGVELLDVSLDELSEDKRHALHTQNKLYLIEGTVPAGYPEPGLFQQSLGWLDENGIGLRYQDFYSNNNPAPARVGRAGQAQSQGRIDAPGATLNPEVPPR